MLTRSAGVARALTQDIHAHTHPRRRAHADAWRSALGGGVPGAAAMFLQVLLLCWLRAIVHYQYAKGGTMLQAARVRRKHVSQHRLHCS
jgi:hypothetical protein